MVRELADGRVDKLVQILAEQRRVLEAAGCDDRIIDDYAALIRFLKRTNPAELGRIFSKRSGEQTSLETERSEAELANMSAGEVESLISDDATPRKFLERVAIHRFQVPKGSMRSFANKAALVEKLLTLLRNERAHTTIETVARGQRELPGVRDKAS